MHRKKVYTSLSVRKEMNKKKNPGGLIRIVSDKTWSYPFFSATISFTPVSFQTTDRSSVTIASGGSTGE
jgi:hypothetical protein